MSTPESNNHTAPAGDDAQTAATRNDAESDVVIVAVDGSKESDAAFECAYTVISS